MVAPTHTISIGRNVGDGPMIEEAWVDFVEALRHHVDVYAAEVYFAGFGAGEWTDETGRTILEESFTIVWAGELSTDDAAELELALAGLADEFGQEAIAWTSGTTNLVAARIEEAVEA